MKPASILPRIFLPAGLVLTVTLACQLTASKTNPGVSTQPGMPFPTETSTYSEEKFTLSEPSDGLTALKSHHATLIQDVTGSLDGEPFERHTRMERTLVNGSGEEWVRELSGTNERPYYEHTLLIGNAFYQIDDQHQECVGRETQPDQPQLDSPATFLLPVKNATPVDRETINGVEAIHYRFDQSNLQLADKNTVVTGEFWIAGQNGSLVRYIFNASPPASPTGKGLEASQQIRYEVDGINSLDQLQLPETCLPVPTSLPLPPGARDVHRTGGMLDFHTTTSAAEIVTFYQEELPGQGWKIVNSKIPAEPRLPFLLNCTQASQWLTVLVAEDPETQGLIDVTITVADLEAAPLQPTEAAPTQTSGPLPTVDPSKSGLPDDIPLYPGATDLKNMGMAILYTAPDPPDPVAQFYRDEMKKNNWTFLNSQSARGNTILIWQKSGQMATIAIQVEEGKVKVVVSLNPAP